MRPTAWMLSLVLLLEARSTPATPCPSFDPSFGSATWYPIPALTDEFAGTSLNRSKWDTNGTDIGWLGRAPSLFWPANAAVANGSLELWARHQNVATPDQEAQGYRNYTTSMVQARTPVVYGLFEIEWRSGSSSTSSSWWFSEGGRNNPNKTRWHTEIDVFETEGNASDIPMSATLPSHTHIFASPYGVNSSLEAKCNCTVQKTAPICTAGNMQAVKPAGIWSEGLHKATLHWNATHLEVFIDGIQFWELTNHCMNVPLLMDFDRETMGNWMALAPLDSLPDAPFTVNYVRSWKANAIQGETLGERCSGSRE